VKYAIPFISPREDEGISYLSHFTVEEGINKSSSRGSIMMHRFNTNEFHG
jgi:hypothetical protein